MSSRTVRQHTRDLPASSVDPGTRRLVPVVDHIEPLQFKLLLINRVIKNKFKLIFSERRKMKIS